MRWDSWAMLGLVIVSLTVVNMGRADAPLRGGPAAEVMPAPPTPHLQVGGRIDRLSRPGKGIVHLSAFVPGARTAVTFFFLRADKSSLLLRADNNGRMTRIELDDLYQGDELDSVRAVITREADPKNHSHLIHWLVVYPKGVAALG
ncbi:MAG: hypothetical protein IRY99_16645 [Isosphaeraceae bacterium]|nr:hypothetical protein [Isosphaeraceae bacterium]